MEGLWGSGLCYHLARVTMERKKQHTQRLESQWEERDNIINASTESKWEERDNIISARWLDDSFFCTACPKSSGATRKHVGLDVSHHKLVVRMDVSDDFVSCMQKGFSRLLRMNV